MDIPSFSIGLTPYMVDVPAIGSSASCDEALGVEDSITTEGVEGVIIVTLEDHITDAKIEGTTRQFPKDEVGEDFESSREFLTNRLIASMEVFTEDIPCANSKKRVFLDEDPEFKKIIEAGGPNPSWHVDNWAKRRFQDFLIYRGWQDAGPLEEMEFSVAGKLLAKFFEHACKLDGSLYPSETLMNLFCSFHRFCERGSVMETAVAEVEFNIRTNVHFKAVTIACVLAMERSRNRGANMPRKKCKVISFFDEKYVLDHLCTSKTHPRSLQRHVVYYILSRFGLRGGQEMYNLLVTDFVIAADEKGRYVKYDERLSKNYKVSLQRYQDEHFRQSVSSYESDFMESMALLIEHLPDKKVDEESLFSFYQPIDSPRTNAWYSRLRMSMKKLSKCLEDTFKECGLSTEGITNKSGKATCVTRMVSEGVPSEVGMHVTGHKSYGAYARYDKLEVAKVRAAQDVVSGVGGYDANLLVEKDLSDCRVIGISSLKIGKDVMPENVMKEEKADVVKKEATAELKGVTMKDIEQPIISDPGEPEAIKKALPEGKKDESQAYDEFLYNLDWEKLGETWPGAAKAMRSVTNVNPIHAELGRIGSISNCTVNITFNGGSSSDTPPSI